MNRPVCLEQVSHRRLAMGNCLTCGLGTAGNTVVKLVLIFLFAARVSLSHAVTPDPDKLRMVPWTPANMVQDPVAVTFDRDGRLYVVETARRSTVDIDMRGHRPWLLEDLANDDFESMRDFFRRQMSLERSNDNQSWLKDRNRDGVHDYRDLTTVKERIRIVEDTDGDGMADKSTLFAEGFNEEFNGVAAGVMPYRGDVFFTVYPDLWRLRDHNGDQVADSQESMFRGFGVHAALDGHDLHGLTLGPEGKIYFSCGDNGFSVTTQEGKRLHYPNTGGVLRMNPDGSDLEVFATGLRNVQEFDFDQYGNMFGVDNDGDLEDERERAVYIAEGSDSGWRLTWQFRSPGWAKYNGGMTYNPWTADGMWKPAHALQPAYITPPMQNYSVGPGGFKFNPGTALNEDYRNFFFCVQFPVQKVTAFRTQPRGAGFTLAAEHVFNSGLMVSSLNFGPDGGIYLADWVGKWQPNGEGVIYRVDDPSMENTPLRQQVKQYINEGVESEPSEQLVELLGHADRRVRQLAQYELSVTRKQLATLVGTANNDRASTLARIHAMWGVIQYHQQNSILPQTVQLPWADPDPQIRQQCARVAGDLRLSACVPHLIKLLADPAALVQSHAAIALGKVRASTAVTQLVELARRNNNEDPFIRHAAIVGLAGCASSDDLAALSSSESTSVHVAAVVALRRQRSDKILAYLKIPQNSTPARLRVLGEAVRAVHDDFSIPGALPQLAQMLELDELPQDEAFIRRAISANFRLGTLSSAQRLVKFIRSPSARLRDPLLKASMQIEALQCLASWDQFPLVDRVEGRIRKPKDRTSNAGRHVLSLELPNILGSVDGAVTAEALRITEELALPIDVDLLARWVREENVSVNARVGALRLLAERNKELFSAARGAALNSKAWPVHQAALEMTVKSDPDLAWRHMDWNTSESQRLQFYISLLPKLRIEAARAKLAALLTQYRAHEQPNAVSLDVFLAATSLPDQQAAWRKELEDSSPLGKFQLAIYGGDPDRGRVVYRNHVSAQCVRCHEAGGMGKQAGPVLTGIASRVNRQYLLESVVTPSAAIAKGFGGVTLILVDGRTVHGTIIRESANEIVLGLANGKRTEVSLDEIEARADSNVSAMPDMTKVLSPLEIRDVVAYLATMTDRQVPVANQNSRED